MTRIVMTSILALGLAVPAIAVASPAEDFGKLKAQDSSSVETLRVAATVLEGDNVDERLPYGANEIPTRQDNSTSQGHQQLARNMGVNAADFTLGELAKMYIGEYD